MPNFNYRKVRSLEIFSVEQQRRKKLIKILTPFFIAENFCITRFDCPILLLSSSSVCHRTAAALGCRANLTVPPKRSRIQCNRWNSSSRSLPGNRATNALSLSVIPIETTVEGVCALRASSRSSVKAACYF